VDVTRSRSDVGGRAATAAFWCESAWLPTGVARSVRLLVDQGRITEVTPGADPAVGDHRLGGLVLPGFANAHSHAFHRALRGRTSGAGGTFWTWRTQMYAVAERLDPDTYLRLARAAYAEMALAGVTAVGEFHYLHHGPGGQPYADPNAMSEALVQAASDAGVRLTLLDTCYLAGGLSASGHQPLDQVQQRFSDGSVDAWAARVERLPTRDGLLVGAAAHSVRAVPRDDLARLRAAVPVDRPLHVHLSEQPAENEAALGHHGRTPTQLLDDAELLGPCTTAVHATHLLEVDHDLLGGSGTGVCACPTTESDLADGLGPFARLRAAGSAISVGSDSHAVVDLLLEARLVEQYERLGSNQRGAWSPEGLVDVLTVNGQEMLGWTDAGRIESGQRADLVAVALDSARTAGIDPAEVVFAATAADVRDVVRDGVRVVTDGKHVLGDVGRLLADAIEPLWRDA
jgi:formiminoglutamate deiminase